MRELSSFDYAVLRVVPHVEREEFVNAGVILLCLERTFLGVRIHVDEDRLRALWPDLDITEVRNRLNAFSRLAAGDPAAGPIALLTARERFHWMVAPRSTLIQVSPVHCGLTGDPEASLRQLSSTLLAIG